MFITSLLMSCLMAVANANPPQIGDYARAFSLPAVNISTTSEILGDSQVSISMYTGLMPQKKTRALVVYFFNLSEGKSLLKELEQIQRSYRKKDVYVVAICTEPGPVTPISTWVESNVSSLPVLRDKYQIVQGRYGVSAVPELFIIDELGRIFSQAKPSQNGFPREIKSEIDALIHQSEMGEITP